MQKIFRKLISLAALAILVSTPWVGPARAQGGLLFGQNHYYTVIFRGNGEAIVYAKLVVTNSGDKPLVDYSFEMPKAMPSEMAIYQMKLWPQCLQTDYNSPSNPCLRYGEPDYNQSYYYGYGYSGATGNLTDYKKIQFTRTGSAYRFVLPTPIDPGQTAAFIIAYAAKGYVSDFLGLKKFSFETLKVDARIKDVKVAVDVDSDLLLKGKRSEVNYATANLSPELGLSSASSAGLGSATMDKMVSSIGSASSPMLKEAKNLAPNESLTVKGEYSASWSRLYLSSIVWTILILAAILAGIYFLVRFLRRRAKNAPSRSAESVRPKALSPVFNVTNAWVSLLSAALVTGLSYLLQYFDKITRIIGYNEFFTVMIGIATLLLFILAIAGPAIIVALRHGWKSLLAILLAEFLWYVIFAIIIIVLFQSGLLHNQPMYY